MIKIFNANDRDFSTNGNIAIDPMKCIETKKKSLNGWYLDVEVAIKYADYIEKDKLCVVQTKSKLNPQAFRIDNPQKTTRRIKFKAYHVMFDAEDYFLLDVRPTNRNGQGALSYVNERTDKNSPFFVYSNVSNINTAYFVRKSLLEAWSIIEERWGGVFDADNWNIRFVNSVGNDNGEVVSYKNNLQGIEIFEDWSSVCTKICPVGYDGIMLPETYLESDIQYEKPYTRTIDFATKYDEEDKTEANLIAELRQNAEQYLEENKYPKISYEITSNIKQSLEIGDTIHIKHPLANILTEVIEYEYNIVSKKVKRIVFGNYDRNVVTKINNIKESISNVAQALSTQEAVIQRQTQMINMLNKTGYVYIDENEILILDRLPKEQAENVWRWGLGGLGFSSNGYEGPFETAITMDGQINANFITTGQLEVSVIRGLSDTLSNYSAQINLNKNNISSVVTQVNQKVDEDDIVSTINQSSDKISLSSNRFEVNSLNDGIYKYNMFDALFAYAVLRGWATISNNLKNVFSQYDDDDISVSDVQYILNILRGTTTNTKENHGTFIIDTSDPKKCIAVLREGEEVFSLGVGGINAELFTAGNVVVGDFSSYSTGYFTGVIINGTTGEIRVVKNDSVKALIGPTTTHFYEDINMNNYSINNCSISGYMKVTNLYDNYSGTTGTVPLTYSARKLRCNRNNI